MSQEETVRLAKELWQIYFYGSHWKRIEYPSNQPQKNSFERLSKHVQKLIINARIEEAIRWGNVYPIPLSVINYKKDLERQLESLTNDKRE